MREIIREIAGHTPLEKRAMELLKNGKDKRCLKLIKRRVSFLQATALLYLFDCSDILNHYIYCLIFFQLGTHKRAKAKREQCAGFLRVAQRKAK